jgi:uncharacterized membrane protein YecN with MAPEG domain
MTPPPLPAITALYSGLAGVLLLVLAGRVSRLRHGLAIHFGDGGNADLARAIRAHGNAVEWALPAILLLLVAELNRAPPSLLHACGMATLVGRALHAIGLSRRPGRSFGRFTGSGLSWLAVLVLALWDVWAFLRLALV